MKFQIWSGNDFIGELTLEDPETIQKFKSLFKVREAPKQNEQANGNKEALVMKA